MSKFIPPILFAHFRFINSQSTLLLIQTIYARLNHTKLVLYLGANSLQQDIVESLNLLKGSLTISEENIITLLDPEHFSKEFKAKIYTLLKKRKFHQKEGEIKSHPEQLALPSGVCDEVQEDLSLDLKALNVEEKEYIVYLSCVHLQLAHQRNQLLHWFYLPAMAALAARNCKHPVSEGMC